MSIILMSPVVLIATPPLSTVSCSAPICFENSTGSHLHITPFKASHTESKILKSSIHL